MFSHILFTDDYVISMQEIEYGCTAFIDIEQPLFFYWAELLDMDLVKRYQTRALEISEPYHGFLSK